MAGLDFKLNTDGDITITNGRFTLVETIQESVRQRLQVKYKTFRGEMYTNITWGIPYRTQDGIRGIIGKGYSKSDIDAVFIAETLAERDVIRILKFNSYYDKYLRDYQVDVEVLTSEGDIRIVSPIASPNDEVEYPILPDFIVAPDCGKGSVSTDVNIVPNVKPTDLLLTDKMYSVI